MSIFRYIYAMLSAAVLSVILPACDDKHIDEPMQPQSDCISLSISVPLATARAASDDLNEFTVNQLHLYYYTKSGHNDDTSEPVYDIAVDGAFEYSRRITLALPDNALKEGGLFGEDSN